MRLIDRVKMRASQINSYGFRLDIHGKDARKAALRLVSKTHAYEAPLRQHSFNKQIVDLTILIDKVNLWNRFAVGMRHVHDVDPAPSGR